jgi:hypothetical protein
MSGVENGLFRQSAASLLANPLCNLFNSTVLQQQTLGEAVSFAGIGLHSGNRVNMSFLPAPPNTGLRFRRVDREGKPEIEALIENVSDTTRSTTLSKGNVRVHTVEHVLATFAGCIGSYLMFMTAHWATYRNENLLQMPPIALAMLLLLPWALRYRGNQPRHPRVLRITQYIALAMAGSSVLGLVLKLLPWFRQDNWNIIAWVLPVNVAVAIILLRRSGWNGRTTKQREVD